MTSFDTSGMRLSMQLFMVRGAYGYRGFSEKVGDNLYKSNFKDFQDTIENAKKPIDESKVSTLSANQKEVLQRTSSGKDLIPLLNRMGQLGVMDVRKELTHFKFDHLFQKSSYTSAINAYQKSV